MKKTLKSKLSWSTILTVFIFGLIGIISIFFQTKSTFISLAKQNLSSESSLLIQGFDNILERGRDLSETIANEPVFVDYMVGDKQIADELTTFRLNFYNIGEIYSATYLVSSSGIVLASTDPSFVGQDYSSRDYFQKSIKGESATDISVGATSKEVEYYFSHPIKSPHGDIIGVAVAKMKPEIINKFIIASNEDRETIMLTDNYGIVIYSNDSQVVYKSLGNLDQETSQIITKNNRFSNIKIEPLDYNIPVLKLLNKENSGIFEIKDKKNNKDKIVSVSKIGKLPFFLLTERDSDQFIYPAIKISFFLSLIIGLSTLCTIFLILFLVNKFLMPLEFLKIGAQEISKGNFNYKLNLSTDDDLVGLGNTFNDMSLKLKNLYSNINKERKKSQRLVRDLNKFKLAVDNASDLIVITDPNDVVLYANPATAKITGYSIGEILGQKPSDLWYRLVDKKIINLISDVVGKKKKIYSGQIELNRRDGAKYVSSVFLAPILYKNKKLEFCVRIEKDITKSKEIDKAKTEFVSLASHQLRTPLTITSWYTEMLLDEKNQIGFNKTQEEYLKKIYSSNHRMIELVNALLNVSRLELGTFVIDPEIVFPNAILESVIDEFKPQIKKKQIKFKKEIYSSLPKKMMLDEKLFRIIVQNLLSNAIKYTPEKGTISIKVKKDKKNLLIIIKDSGYGIPIVQQSQIFTKLFRADNVKQTDVDGTGLGLYIVKSILDHTDGKIWFESEENKGSTFFVTLPIKGMKRQKGLKRLN
ncbi:PAS domain S-box protein [Patescibacteria group bacterium]|nr:PAS domain S-box protein [Patescibacteria group bacterium]